MMGYDEWCGLCRTVGDSAIATMERGVKQQRYVEDIDITRTGDPVVARPSGILLQRCGGGVRVLRKRIGGA